jgi:hypothetical protein
LAAKRAAAAATHAPAEASHNQRRLFPACVVAGTEISAGATGGGVSDARVAAGKRVRVTAASGDGTAVSISVLTRELLSNGVAASGFVVGGSPTSVSALTRAQGPFKLALLDSELSKERGSVGRSSQERLPAALCEVAVPVLRSATPSGRVVS